MNLKSLLVLAALSLFGYAVYAQGEPAAPSCPMQSSGCKCDKGCQGGSGECKNDCPKPCGGKKCGGGACPKKPADK